MHRVITSAQHRKSEPGGRGSMPDPEEARTAQWRRSAFIAVIRAEPGAVVEGRAAIPVAVPGRSLHRLEQQGRMRAPAVSAPGIAGLRQRCKHGEGAPHGAHPCQSRRHAAASAARRRATVRRRRRPALVVAALRAKACEPGFPTTARGWHSLPPAISPARMTPACWMRWCRSGRPAAGPHQGRRLLPANGLECIGLAV